MEPNAEITPNSQTDSHQIPEVQAQNTLRDGLSRRQFLGVGAAAAAAALVRPQSAQAMQSFLSEPTPPPLAASSRIAVPQNPLFSSPASIPAGNGRINMAIELQTVDDVPLAGSGNPTGSIQVRTFDRQIPGNTIVAAPGEAINIQVTNTLQGEVNPTPTPNPCNNLPKRWNTSNLHFHGLHVSPKSVPGGASSDDVLFELGPQGNQDGNPTQHEWWVQLPDDHAPGTHWYHTHHHGATAIQVTNGMAGAIIIPDPPEMSPVEGGATGPNDYVWLLQELNSVVYPGQTGGIPASEFLINGASRPIMDLDTNKLQRWRFINATGTPRGLLTLQVYRVSDYIDTLADEPINTWTHIPGQDPSEPTQGADESDEDFQVRMDAYNRCRVLTRQGRDCDTEAIYEPIDMNLMAVDGISFYGKYPQPVSAWEFNPGNRADFLMNLQRGFYKVVAGNQVIAYVNTAQNCTVDPTGTRIETAPYPNYLKPIKISELGQATSKDRLIQYSIIGPDQSQNPPTDPPQQRQFLVNGRVYDPTRMDVSTALGNVELWELRNAGFLHDTKPVRPDADPPNNTPRNQFTPGATHPFHIHVNPFQLVGDLIDPQGENDSSNWRWWDTIGVNTPPNSGLPGAGEPRYILQRYLDYDGTFVQHCHILIHEDQGMMQNIEITGDGIGPGQPSTGTPDLPNYGGAYVSIDDIEAATPIGPDVNDPAYSAPITTCDDGTAQPPVEEGIFTASI